MTSVPAPAIIRRTEEPGGSKIVDLLERYVPDRRARDRVLVDNPARFFGFD